MSVPSHRYAKRAQIAPYLEPVAADFDVISAQAGGARIRHRIRQTLTLQHGVDVGVAAWPRRHVASGLRRAVSH